MSTADDMSDRLCHMSHQGGGPPRITDLYEYGHLAASYLLHSFFITFGYGVVCRLLRNPKVDLI